MGADRKTIHRYAQLAKQVRREHVLRSGRQLGGGSQGFLQRVTAADGTSLVLKVGATLEEVRAQVHAAAHGAPVPSIMAFSEPDHGQPGWLLMEYVEVQSVSFRDDPLAPSPLQGRAERMAEPVLRLHACPEPEGMKHSLDWYADRMRTAGGLARRLGQKVPDEMLQEIFARCSDQPLVLIHGDCSWQNVQERRDDGRYVLFDVSGFVGPAASDFAEWSVSAAQWPPHLAPLVDELLAVGAVGEEALMPWLTLAIGSRGVEESERDGGHRAVQWLRMFAEAVRLGDIRETFSYGVPLDVAMQMRLPNQKP